jgi:hypothetical protein
MSEPYFNESQNFGLIAGSIVCGAQDIISILPTFKGCDGMGILDCLKLNKRVVRVPLLMMPFVLVGAYLKNESK